MLERQSGKGEGEDSELISKIKIGKIQTTSIRKVNLPFYKTLGFEIGFNVEQIADEGERFPRLRKGDSKINIKNSLGKSVYEFREGISYLKVKKGFVAISIERPEGVDNHRAFWERTINISQKASKDPRP